LIARRQRIIGIAVIRKGFQGAGQDHFGNAAAVVSGGGGVGGRGVVAIASRFDIEIVLEYSFVGIQFQLVD